MQIHKPIPYKKFDALLVENSVTAGFESAVHNFSETRIDITKELVANPAATFFARVSGDSMILSGIEHNDILIIDKSLEPRNNKIAVCFLDGTFTVKRLRIKNKTLFLVPENDEYEPIQITENNHFIIWGIVTFIIKPA